MAGFLPFYHNISVPLRQLPLAGRGWPAVCPVERITCAVLAFGACEAHAGAAAVLIDEFDACESHDAPNEHPTASEIARGKQPLPLRP